MTDIYPLAMANNLIVPALMAGNTVVFKPSEETPLVADLFVSLLNRVLPENVLQIVHGSGTQGPALVESPVNIITFTGSRAAGKDIRLLIKIKPPIWFAFSSVFFVVSMGIRANMI